MDSDFVSFLQEFGASLPLDKKLYRQDIEGSKAHCKMLAKQGIISEEESLAILKGLDEILAEIDSGEFQFSIEREDIHMNVEHRLMEKIGETGGKLHTARSRNDQVALDERLYLRDAVKGICARILELNEVLTEKAEAHMGVAMPGYTHLQRAQPILFSHHLLAYFEKFKRDFGRFDRCYESTNVLPLGAGALAGVDFPVDREYTAKLLGFDAVSANSLDSVSDRDFLLEFLFASSVLGIHLSRFCEEIVLWCSQEFGFVSIADEFCTGSSIMPQKRNPDYAELIRGKSGVLTGNLISMMVTLKGLPLAYNKDMQEDKRPMIETAETVDGCLRVFTEMFRTLEPRAENMARALARGHMTATDLADYLVEKGFPFRKAHGVVAGIVRHCTEKDITLESLDLEALRAFDPAFDEGALKVLDPVRSVDKRNSLGGTAKVRVQEALKAAQGWVVRHKTL